MGKVDYEQVKDKFNGHSWSLANEAHTFQVLQQTSLWRKGLVFFDVGCQKGMYSEGILNYCDYPTVYAFDIINHPETAELEDEFNNFTFVHTAVGSKQSDTGVADICDHAGSLVDISDCLVLDSFVEENNIERVDLVKIDVEGWELDVLKGMRHILTTMKPNLVVEIMVNRQDRNKVGEVFQYLYELGYKVLAATDANNIHFHYHV